ncbi:MULTISPECIES: menaquinone biosynthesis protein [Bacillaceae]|uniref:Chorismate dehydratase n=1 Tax=Evansella alkalicola TaxID=745819 RepID=A0ABS6K0I8_9BACI|nr:MULTISPECIES: menaquinone biosynthesis protein [Bacillaceae]MBU9723952.1 menaquinone biosynthesis protein [Bacillus alkalicola]
MSLVIGEISYTNILPIFYYINRDKLVEQGCEFVPKVPAKLNAGMADGTVHLGGISSFAYGEHSDEYLLLPDLSVSSPKEVGSIFLFSKVPITQLDGKSIGLTSTSATSVNLLKVILNKFYEIDVSYETMAPDFQEMLSRHDACLLIGDDAIVNSWHLPMNIHQYDLGALWNYFTGFPMTYAVFAVSENAWKREDALLGDVYEQFQTSKQLCINNQFTDMIKSIKTQMGGTQTFWEQYFHGLNYDLSDRHLEGLYHYFDHAYDLNLLSKKVDKISLWNPTEHCHSV